MNLKTESNSTTYEIVGWISQITIILTLFNLMNSILIQNNKFDQTPLTYFMCAYIFYIIVCFSSPSFNYALNNHHADTIHNKMKKYFYTSPSIIFKAECYHWETHEFKEKTDDGKKKIRTSQKKVVTSTTKENFHYYSWRDISGIFLLDSEKILKDEEKVFIKLELELNLEFADDISKLDYEKQKRIFKRRNIFKDDHMEFSENIELKEFEKYNMVKISTGKDVPYLNMGMYLLFTFILPIIEFYKIYMNSFCVQQNFTIKKLISTRNDLNNDRIYANYDELLPKINISGNETAFNLLHQNNQKVYNFPTEEELKEARTYSSSKVGSMFEKNQTLNKNDFKSEYENNPNYHDDEVKNRNSFPSEEMLFN